MGAIKITEEQRDRLCDELAKLVFEFRENRNIECIYFRTFMGLLGYGKNVLDLVLVTNGNIEEEDKQCVRGFESYTSEDTLNEYGVKIHICMDDASLYKNEAHNMDETIRQNELFNSTILFDRTGKCSEIKDRVQRIGINADIYYYEDLADLFPPIGQTLANAMDIARMERDTKAGKEFTKSEYFEYIKKM